MWRVLSHALGTSAVALTQDHARTLLERAAHHVQSIVDAVAQGKVIFSIHADVLCLCLILERLLEDGVKGNSLWFAYNTQEHTRKEELDVIISHPFTRTPKGKWRAWLVSQLEECMLYVSLYMILSDKAKLKSLYETLSVIRVPSIADELLSIAERLDNVAVNLAGFTTIEFDTLHEKLADKIQLDPPPVPESLAPEVGMDHPDMISWMKQMQKPKTLIPKQEERSVDPRAVRDKTEVGIFNASTNGATTPMPAAQESILAYSDPREAAANNAKVNNTQAKPAVNSVEHSVAKFAAPVGLREVETGTVGNTVEGASVDVVNKTLLETATDTPSAVISAVDTPSVVVSVDGVDADKVQLQSTQIEANEPNSVDEANQVQEEPKLSEDVDEVKPAKYTAPVRQSWVPKGRAKSRTETSARAGDGADSGAKSKRKPKSKRKSKAKNSANDIAVDGESAHMQMGSLGTPVDSLEAEATLDANESSSGSRDPRLLADPSTAARAGKGGSTSVSGSGKKTGRRRRTPEISAPPVPLFRLDTEMTCDGEIQMTPEATAGETVSVADQVQGKEDAPIITETGQQTIKANGEIEIEHQQGLEAGEDGGKLVDVASEATSSCLKRADSARVAPSTKVGQIIRRYESLTGLEKDMTQFQVPTQGKDDKVWNGANDNTNSNNAAQRTRQGSRGRAVNSPDSHLVGESGGSSQDTPDAAEAVVRGGSGSTSIGEKVMSSNSHGSMSPGEQHDTAALGVVNPDSVLERAGDADNSHETAISSGVSVSEGAAIGDDQSESMDETHAGGLVGKPLPHTSNVVDTFHASSPRVHSDNDSRNSVSESVGDEHRNKSSERHTAPIRIVQTASQPDNAEVEVDMSYGKAVGRRVLSTRLHSLYAFPKRLRGNGLQAAAGTDRGERAELARARSTGIPEGDRNIPATPQASATACETSASTASTTDTSAHVHSGNTLNEDLSDMMANKASITKKKKRIVSESGSTSSSSRPNRPRTLPGEVVIDADLHLLLTLCALHSGTDEDGHSAGPKQKGSGSNQKQFRNSKNVPKEIPCRLMRCWQLRDNPRRTPIRTQHDPSHTQRDKENVQKTNMRPVYFLVTTARICLLSRLPTELDVDWVTTHPELVMAEWSISRIKTVRRGLFGQMLNVGFNEAPSADRNTSTREADLVLQFGDPSATMAVGVDLKVILATHAAATMFEIHNSEASHPDTRPMRVQPVVDLNCADSVLRAALEDICRDEPALVTDTEALPSNMEPDTSIHGLQVYLKSQWAEITPPTATESRTPLCGEQCTCDPAEENGTPVTVLEGSVDDRPTATFQRHSSRDKRASTRENRQAADEPLNPEQAEAQASEDMHRQAFTLLSIDNCRLSALQSEHIPWYKGPVQYRGSRFKVATWKEIGVCVYKNGELQRSEHVDGHMTAARYSKTIQSVRYPPGQWISGGRCEFEVVFTDMTSHIFAVSSGYEARRWIAAALLSANDPSVPPQPVRRMDTSPMPISKNPNLKPASNHSNNSSHESYGTQMSYVHVPSNAYTSHMRSPSPSPVPSPSAVRNTRARDKPRMVFICDGPCRLFIHEISTSNTTAKVTGQVCHFFLYDLMLVVTYNTTKFTTTVPSVGENEIQCALMLDELFLSSDSADTFLLTHRDQCVSVRLPLRLEASKSKIKRSEPLRTHRLRRTIEECIRKQSTAEKTDLASHIKSVPSDIMSLDARNEVGVEGRIPSCSILVTNTHLCLSMENHFAMEPHVRLKILERIPLCGMDVQFSDDSQCQVTITKKSRGPAHAHVCKGRDPNDKSPTNGETQEVCGRRGSDTVLARIEFCSLPAAVLLYNLCCT